MTPRRLRAALACFVAAAMAGACGGGGSGGGSNGSPDGGVVNGTSRISWDQQAADATELAALHFVIYIDGTRTELTGASCSTPAGSAGFPCESLLPTMSTGQHTIQLASYIVAGSILESPKSASLVITVSGSSGLTTSGVTVEAQAPAASVPAPTPLRELITRDGARLQITVLADAERPSALAVSEDGAVFIADRSGYVRIVRNGKPAGESALTVADDGREASGDILDLALDPQFARNHFVYVLDAPAGQPATFRLARFREVGGRFGERAVLFDSVPASPIPSGSLAFGPDTRLYVALDDGGDPVSARRAASYNGKVLRLNADGTTPGDQPGATPVYASNLHAPRSLAWDASTSSLWVADAGARRTERIRGSDRRALVVTPYRLPLVGGPRSLAMYRGALIPVLQGSLLVAPVEDVTYLLRARFSDTDQNAIASTERLGISGGAFVRLVKVGPDGAIYVATDREVLRIVAR
jgi:glucose/arabinose dehydrogenase